MVLWKKKTIKYRLLLSIFILKSSILSSTTFPQSLPFLLQMINNGNQLINKLRHNGRIGPNLNHFHLALLDIRYDTMLFSFRLLDMLPNPLSYLFQHHLLNSLKLDGFLVLGALLLPTQLF
jgi:hypothetical protein